MNPKWLVGSTVLHLLIVAGLVLYSPQELPIEEEPPYFELSMVAAEPAGIAVIKEQMKEKSLPKKLKKPSNITKAEETFGTKRVSSEQKLAIQATVTEIPTTNHTEKETVPVVAGGAKPIQTLSQTGSGTNSVVQETAVQEGSSGNKRNDNSNQSNGASAATNVNTGPPSSSETVSGSKNLVDHPPVPIYKLKPPYPVDAQNKGWTGRVRLSAVILVNGKVSKVEVVQSSGYAVLDEAAKKAYQKWKFKPALKDGKPVECPFDQAFNFNLEDLK